MLQKHAERIIMESAKLAGVISPETVLTAAELDDAMYNLNCLLQSMNNDGFHLFTMKTGYLPLLPKKNEYSMATEAYEHVQKAKIRSVDKVGALKVKLENLAGISTGQTIRFQNNTTSVENTIFAVDYDENSVTMETPLNMSVYAGDTVYYGLFSMADAVMVSSETDFNTLGLESYESAPMAGQNLMFKFENDWFRASVVSFNAASKTITFSPALPAGAITARAVLFGQNINVTKVAADALTDFRAITFDNPIENTPCSLSLVVPESLNYDILRISGNVVYLKTPVPVSVIQGIATAYLYAEKPVKTKTVTAHYEFTGLTDPAISSFAKIGSTELAIVDYDSGRMLLTRSVSGGIWGVYDTSTINAEIKDLYMVAGKVVLGTTDGLYNVSNATPVSLIEGIDVDAIVEFNGAYYVISTPESGSVTRIVVKTADFDTIEDPYNVAGIESVKNPVVFKDKLYIGSNMTTVTSDMEHFEQIPIYSENRCIVGDRLLNINSEQVCSYSVDGINFHQMPFRQSNQVAWAYKDGCSVIAITDDVVTYAEQPCTQLFMTNKFESDWQMKAVVNGAVSKMFFVDNKLYAVSSYEVKEIEVTIDSAANDEQFALLCGNPIGRPQQLMTVTKYGFGNQTQLPMEAIPVKEYERLPHRGSDGEPVTYCFFRDAKDGKMMVWGTPTKFGEYLKFTYVQTLHLLDGVRDIPDFPDEYVSAVIDALAVDFAHQYKLPDARIKELEAKAEKSMENAMLHDNEDTSYRIGISSRGY